MNTSNVERREIRQWLTSIGGKLQAEALRAQMRGKLSELRELCRDTASAEEAGVKAIRIGGYLDALEYIIEQSWFEHIIFNDETDDESKEEQHED